MLEAQEDIKQAALLFNVQHHSTLVLKSKRSGMSAVLHYGTPQYTEVH
jgi:hypothetical protein